MTSHDTVAGDQQPDPSVPLFTIGTVSRRVGISTPALRMWEERYEVVEPYRDEHGRRLYSQNQIDDLVWVRHAIDNGLTAAEAHRMLETRRATQPMTTPVDPRAAFRTWVLTDHGWLRRLCGEKVEDASGALVASVGVHDVGTPGDAESWLLVSCLRSDRPSWFVASVHRAASLSGDRLAAGETVSFSHRTGDEEVTEIAMPVIVEDCWVGTVALAFGRSRPDGAGEVASFLHRVEARHEAWRAYSKFEQLTRPDPSLEADSA